MVVGLGNPGPNYQNTRHNAGFWFVDRWAGVRGVSFRKPWFRPFLWAESRDSDGHVLHLIKPLTFMNRSGAVLGEVFARTGATPEELLVVFDQMDLPPGRARLKPHGSSGGHNGLNSIDAFLGTGGYHRLAVGIGRPEPGVSVVDHVLGVPSEADRALIDSAIERILPSANQVWSRGWEPLIHVVNQRGPAP